MLELRQTDVFLRWYERLADRRAKKLISFRLERLGMGRRGHVRQVGEGVSELRIDFGPGYRVYFTRRDRAVILLLAGGDKGSQGRDITRALRLARGL